ncbi:MAG: hypothetical protein NTX25_04780, partial [Proteobacteria bacterium]|nr:hypothetical protein [Pseudomonadota bacterium]
MHTFIAPTRQCVTCLTQFCVLSVLLSSCLQLSRRHLNSDLGSQSPDTALSASDVSIFVPLKPFKATSPQDPFQMEGDGFCNAASLSLGDDNPILSREIFKQIAADSFGKIAAITINPDDPCTNKPEIPGFERKTSLPPECTVNEARLVVQPFVRAANGAVDVVDVSMHLIYNIPNLSELIQDLKELHSLTVESLAQNPWGGPTDNNPRMLRPHPGLRGEMTCLDGRPRPIGEAFFKLLKKHTNTQRLTSISFMTSTASAGQWSFGTRSLDGSVLLGTEDFENFSLKQFTAGKAPFNIPRNEINSILPLYTNKMTEAELKEFSGILNDISNPRKVSQVLNTPGKGSTCVSCHLPEFTMAELGRRINQPLFSGIRPYQREGEENPAENSVPPIWRPFKFAKAKNIQNLRNFGYGPAFSFG